MLEVPRYDVYEASTFFADGMTMREPPKGTIPYGRVPRDPATVTGKRDGEFVTSFPIDLSDAVLGRGRSKFEQICAACHGIDGSGNEMVSRHMRRPPPPLYSPRVVELPVGEVFWIVSRGYGLMPAYAAQLDILDRWAVVAYVSALQRSRNAVLDFIPDDIRRKLARRQLR
jgi:mono/diheme cytochrome c family protein